MTFVELQDDVLDRIGNSEPRARQRIKRALNEWYRRICAEVGLDYLLLDTKTNLSLVGGTSEYAVPAAIRKVRSIQIPTQRVTLREIGLPLLREMDPADDTTGIPSVYALRGQRTLKFFPIPSANMTATIDGQGVLTELTTDAGVPVIPEEYHYLLALGALSREYEKVDDSRRFLTARKDLEAGIASLQHYVHTRARAQATLLGPSQPSRLGGWYPAGS